MRFTLCFVVLAMIIAMAYAQYGMMGGRGRRYGGGMGNMVYGGGRGMGYGRSYGGGMGYGRGGGYGYSYMG